jgi:hypothetical protein
MRILGPRTHVLLAVAAAAGLLTTLGRPWYGAAPGAGPVPSEHDLAARVDAGAAAVARALAEPGGTTGWDALARADLVLAGLAGAIVLLAVMSLAAPLAQSAGGLARAAALAALGIVAWRLVDAPGQAALEPRSGLLAALACAVVALACVSATAAAPPRRVRPVARYTPPPPPPRDTSASYGPPQY